jgi:hypothetical protein
VNITLVSASPPYIIGSFETDRVKFGGRGRKYDGRGEILVKKFGGKLGYLQDSGFECGE